MANVIVNEENLKLLKVLYKNAMCNDEDTLMFQGEELVVTYVKCLIEYIEYELKALK